MKNNDRLTSRAGFTLIELLVTMAVSLIVLFAVLQLFENSQKSYVVQEEVAETQQNVRIAKMFMERDIRMAGAAIPDFTYGGLALYPFEFENNVDGSAGQAATIPNIVAGTDLLVVRYLNFGAAACGVDPLGASQACDSLSQITLAADMPPTATVANVLEDITTGSGWDGNCYCNGTTYTQPTPGMPFIVASLDGSQSAILFHTSTLPASDRIGNAPNFTFDGVTYPNKLLNTFPTGSSINFFPTDGIYNALYYIENQSGIPCLVRDIGSGGQVIAEYVEDMQLSFGLDTTGDGAVDTTINGADLSGTSTEDVRMVTLNLLGRSPNPHQNFSGQRPAMEDHTAGAADGFRRRQLSVTIKVRNLGL
jgi:prepilin-type N-terminal cleavage/methylation domain-containing protein